MAVNAYGQPRSGYGSGPSTGKLVGIGLVILLHIGIVYGLLYGLDRAPLEFVPPPIETKIIDQVQEKKQELPPPPPKLAPPPPPFVPPPEVHIETPAPAASTAPTAITTVKPTEAPPAPPPQAKVDPKLDKAHSHEPEFPPTEERLGHQGTVVLSALVDGDGKVLDVKIQKSCGYQRLDDAAVAAIKAGAYKFVPGTVDGKPAPLWLTFNFKWENPNL